MGFTSICNRMHGIQSEYKMLDADPSICKELLFTRPIISRISMHHFANQGFKLELRADG